MTKLYTGLGKKQGRRVHNSVVSKRRKDAVRKYQVLKGLREYQELCRKQGVEPSPRKGQLR